MSDSNRYVVWALACACGALLSGCSPPNSQAIHFTTADYWQQVPSIAEDRPPPQRISVAADAPWKRVTLPHVIPRDLVNNTSQSDTVWATRWYRMQWQPQDTRGLPQVLYVPRVHVFADIDVYVDGQHVVGDSNAGWNNPLFFLLPPQTNTSDLPTHEILIAISNEPSYGSAISSVWIGPPFELRPRWEARDFLQRGLPRDASLAILALGLLAIVFWLRRRAERTYLFFGLIAPLYFLRTLHYYVDSYVPTIIQPVYVWVTSSSLGWLQVLTYFFAATLHGQRFPRAERIIVGATLVVSVVSLIVNLTVPWYSNFLPLSYVFQFCISIAAIALTTLGALRGNSTAARALTVMLWLFLAIGVHDWLLQSWYIDLESIFLMPYGGLLVITAALAAIVHRYNVAIDETDRLNASLERRLTERSLELEESHRKLRLIEHEQAIVGERQRLMREMHDGLGSSLMSSLVMVEQGKLDHSQVATVLRESLDDLKLTIDSLEPMGDDLLTLLGTLRYRLGKRLEAAGIKLEWSVAETPPVPWLNPTSSLQILRILQEALTNTVKHARATLIRVETLSNDDTVSIRLIDNGVGFDVDAAKAAPTGRGLQNLERRAATLSSRVQIRSSPGQTVLELTLPRERRAVPR